ncbi:MAG: LD-carboxypeptidase, partial [Clostridiales bacterium]|nr:LD-carboxypeptidase [Clostridiales bacterium]
MNSHMICPDPLQPGDRVAILAPSGPCDGSFLVPAVKSLEKLGLRVHVTESCRSRHGYLAGSDALRAADVNGAFADRDIRGIFALRGGYGSQRILPLLDFGMIRRHPKVFAGYSDVTALHTAFSQLCGFVTFHAPMPATELRDGIADDFTLRSLTDTLFRPLVPIPFPMPKGHQMETLAPGRAEGCLTGGNLSLLASSLGTPYEWDAADRIIFMEEVNEEPYRIDRLLLQLKLAGKFRRAKGIILGGFHPEDVDSLRMAIDELLVPEG